MVSRPEARGSRALAAARERHAAVFTDLTLAPLSAAAALEMASKLLSLAELPEALRLLLVRRAEGNPFYVEEMIRSLIEQGALVRAEARGAGSPGRRSGGSRCRTRSTACSWRAWTASPPRRGSSHSGRR